MIQVVPVTPDSDAMRRLLLEGFPLDKKPARD